MSRPQYNQHSRYASAGDSQCQTRGNVGVVNGGLIDFYDNPQRPMQVEYVNSTPASVMPGSTLLSIPGMANNGVGGNAVGGTGCFTGPPSFLHVNGVTYRPVEPPLAPVVERPPVGDVNAASTESVDQVSSSSGAHAAVSTKVLTEAELNRIVDDRVRQRVSAQVKGYLTRRPDPRADDMDDAVPRGGRHARSSHASVDKEETERRVERPARYYDDDEGDRPRSSGVQHPRYRDDERVRSADTSDREVRRAPRSTYKRDSDMEAALAKVRNASKSMSERVTVGGGNSVSSSRAGVVW
jgi:hypothetical protein